MIPAGPCRWIALAMLILSVAALRLHAQSAPSTTTQMGSTTQSGNHGPETVVLNALESLYEPVPFDHKTHAEMAEMWDGCTSCHHRPPSTQPSADATVADHHKQDSAAAIPACRSCHEIGIDQADIRMPALKGAYHRQCLNCHREWAGANSCTICHQPKNPEITATQPTPGDIVGRMHPPVPEPDEVAYQARFEPAMGSNILFRHKEHSTTYGLKCVNCHRHDPCASCHSAKPATTGPRPMKPGRTWAQTHEPCRGCHQQDRCATCHYEDGDPPPPPFEHRTTGQILDTDHASLRCGECHSLLKARTVVTCGAATCHPKAVEVVAFPAQRPGPTVTTRPAATTAASSRPIVESRDEDGVIIKRVRRAPAGGAQ